MKNMENNNKPMVELSHDLEICPICGKNENHPKWWSCEKCATTLSVKDYNQFLIENYKKIFKTNKK